jgi:hypothetical protein
MMLCGVLVMFGSFTVMLRSLLGHEFSPKLESIATNDGAMQQSACPRIVKTE